MPNVQFRYLLVNVSFQEVSLEKRHLIFIMVPGGGRQFMLNNNQLSEANQLALLENNDCVSNEKPFSRLMIWKSSVRVLAKEYNSTLKAGVCEDIA